MINACSQSNYEVLVTPENKNYVCVFKDQSFKVSIFHSIDRTQC